MNGVKFVPLLIVEGVEKELYTRYSVEAFLACTGQSQEVYEDAQVRMNVITRNGEFPELDVRYVLESAELITAFYGWIAGKWAAGLHSFNAVSYTHLTLPTNREV